VESLKASEKKIEEIKTYDREMTYRDLTEKYKKDFEIIEEKKKIEYKFPLSFKKYYQMKIEILDDLEKKETERKKRTLLETLKGAKEIEADNLLIDKEVKIKEHLRKQEIDRKITDHWFNELKQEMKLEGKEKITETKAIEYIQNKLKILLNKGTEQEIKGVCLFFGVTGIGKTTTIVKLAKRLEEKRKMGVITTDDYKMDAYHQMEQYAKILKIQSKRSKVDELDFPINAFKYQEGKDTILIDTAGRSPKHPQMKEEIEKYIKEIKPDHKILVLAANQKYSDMVFTIEVFKEVGITDFIFTKIDETENSGCIVNIAEKFGKPIRYITNGQEVPTDIEKMDGEKWAKEFFKEYK
jgi:flagellar biosynthesis protein FlhF